jgi:hypothetical protein
VQGLKSAKEIWDVLKTAPKGDEVTKITKRETIKGELGRFILNKGEETQTMYNRLKTMVNQVRNLGSTKWDDHEMVKVILRSLAFRNPIQVQLIRGDSRYKQMSPEEVTRKFVSFELMIKDSKHIVNLEQGATSTPEVQPVAFKATVEKKEESTPTSRLPIDASMLDNEEMALIIKSFRQILKQRKGKDYKPCSKRVCYRCGKSDHFIAKCPYISDSDRDDDKKGKKKMEKKIYYNKKGVEAHMRREWDSDESSTDSSEELNACKPSTSTVEHVTICTRCRDVNIDAMNDHLAIIKEQNNRIAKLNAKIAEHELENENFKFAHSMLYNGRRPGIKDGIGFQQGWH